MAEEYAHCPKHVPKLHLYDADMALIVMQYLEPPHNILRCPLAAAKLGSGLTMVTNKRAQKLVPKLHL